MKQGDYVKLLIDDLGMNGEGIAHSDGSTVFVPFACVGESVTAKIDFVKKGLAFATLRSVDTPSPDRVTPVCPYFGECGGCDVQQLSREAQLRFKRRRIEICFQKAAVNCPCGVDEVVTDGVDYAYRNKFQLPFGFVGGKTVLGFYRKNTHSVVPMTECPLHGEWAERVIDAVCRWANDHRISVYDERTKKGLLRHLVCRKVNDSLSITIVVCGNGLPEARGLIDNLKQHFRDFSLYVSPNKRDTNVVLGDTAKLVFGKEKPLSLHGLSVQVHPFSFLQVNDGMSGILYDAVLQNLADAPVVVDAYSGAGLLTALAAKKYPNARVFGIEIVPEAVHDADQLMQTNGLSSRVQNICGDCAKALPALCEKLRQDDLQKAIRNSDDLSQEALNAAITNLKTPVSVILDPPRKGCETEVLEAILLAAPTQIIYVSCNPATLARDLSILQSAYVPTLVRPFDLFPQTSHVETLICLSKKS